MMEVVITGRRLPIQRMAVGQPISRGLSVLETYGITTHLTLTSQGLIVSNAQFLMAQQ